MNEAPLRLVPAGAQDWPRAWAIQRAAFLEAVTRSYGGWDAAQERRCLEAWSAETTRMAWLDDRRRVFMVWPEDDLGPPPRGQA